MAKPRRRTVDRWKTKKWYNIVAPKMFEEKPVGVTPASDPGAVLGRVVAIDLYSLLGKRDLQHVKVKFKIRDLNGETAVTTPVGHELQRAYVGRITRRVHTVVTAIPTVKTPDGYMVQITAIAVSRGKAQSSQRKEIRRIMVEKIMEASKKPFEKFFHSLVFGELAGEIYKEVKKIFPINRVEIVKTEVLKNPELEEVK